MTINDDAQKEAFIAYSAVLFCVCGKMEEGRRREGGREMRVYKVFN